MNPVGFLINQFREAPRKTTFFRSLALGNRGGNTTVTSDDGTTISVRQSGSGTPLVLVHGVLDGMGGWSFIEPYLAKDFSVSVYDRRGRGESDAGGDAYGIEKEVEDLAAVIKSTGEAPHVVAHSMGAVIAMLAHLDGVPMRSLVLYEPPMNGSQIDESVIEEISRLVDADELDQAIRLMAGTLAGVSEDEIGIALKIPPVRNSLRDGVKVAPREIAALRNLTWSGLPIKNTPTLVLSGADSNIGAYPRPDQLNTIADNIESAELAGQRHLAHTFAARAFLEAVQHFVRAN